jgi:hypothetical protein
MSTKTRYFVIVSLLVTVVGIGTGLVAYYAGFQGGGVSGPTSLPELRYVPREAGVVAYVDVRQVMASELRKHLQWSPERGSGQQEFQNQTGVNIETDIDYIVAYTEPSDSARGQTPGMLLANGTFGEAKVEASMREHGAQVEPYKGKRLIVVPEGAFSPRDSTDPRSGDPAASPRRDYAVSFLKPGLIAVGNTYLVRRAIDLEGGGDRITTNEEMMNLIQSLDSGHAWAVGRFDALRSVAVLPDGVNQLSAISWFSVTGKVADGVTGVVRAETRDEESANNLRDLMRGFMALAKLQGGSQPGLQALVQSLQLGGTGKTVALSFSISAEAFELMSPGSKKSAGRQQAH